MPESVSQQICDALMAPLRVTNPNCNCVSEGVSPLRAHQWNAAAEVSRQGMVGIKTMGRKSYRPKTSLTLILGTPTHSPGERLTR